MADPNLTAFVKSTHARLVMFEDRMEKIKRDMQTNTVATAQNTDSIEQIRQNTQDIVDTFPALAGGLQGIAGAGKAGASYRVYRGGNCGYVGSDGRSLGILEMIPQSLKQKILAAAVGGPLVIAGVLVAHFEPGKVRGKLYIDPVGVLTVCDGHTDPDIDPKRLYTDAVCDAWRDSDLAIADRAVRRLITAPLNDWQRAAHIDFTYNLGAGNLGQSTMRRKFNAGDYAGGCAEFERWVKGRQGGVLVTLPGLVSRREVDKWVCLQS
ncbi:lysozyme [Achromobacter xylosoxidans]|uniref:lysozyme n=1 Tax=Alcaligenes xylosoxydans xylosoxydans TaxID=85698 RepID=UPI00211AAE6B|nr:lysozyme [Achromobacter xylosoxidans]